VVNPDVEAVGIGRQVATVTNFLQTDIVEGRNVSRKGTVRPWEESTILRAVQNRVAEWPNAQKQCVTVSTGTDRRRAPNLRSMLRQRGRNLRQSRQSKSCWLVLKG
jgi:hypothetical protein